MLVYVCIMYAYICVWMCLYVYECVISLKQLSALRVFAMLDEAGISALGGKRVKSVGIYVTLS